jgi:hypothetical protein
LGYAGVVGVAAGCLLALTWCVGVSSSKVRGAKGDRASCPFAVFFSGQTVVFPFSCRGENQFSMTFEEDTSLILEILDCSKIDIVSPEFTKNGNQRGRLTRIIIHLPRYGDPQLIHIQRDIVFISWIIRVKRTPLPVHATSLPKRTLIHY